MFKKKKVVRKANMIVEEPEEFEEESEDESELPTFEDEVIEAVKSPVKPQQVSKPRVIQVPVFLTQADMNKLVYENNLMLREVLKLAKEE